MSDVPRLVSDIAFWVGAYGYAYSDEGCSITIEVSRFSLA